MRCAGHTDSCRKHFFLPWGIYHVTSPDGAKSVLPTVAAPQHAALPPSPPQKSSPFLSLEPLREGCDLPVLGVMQMCMHKGHFGAWGRSQAMYRLRLGAGQAGYALCLAGGTLVR